MTTTTPASLDGFVGRHRLQELKLALLFALYPGLRGGGGGAPGSRSRRRRRLKQQEKQQQQQQQQQKPTLRRAALPLRSILGSAASLQHPLPHSDRQLCTRGYGGGRAWKMKSSSSPPETTTTTTTAATTTAYTRTNPSAIKTACNLH